MKILAGITIYLILVTLTCGFFDVATRNDIDEFGDFYESEQK